MPFSGQIPRDRWLNQLLGIAGVGLLVRLAFVWGITRLDEPLGDQLFYSAQAHTNALNRWFEQPFASGMPAADHPPLTALLLTPITWLFRNSASFVTAQRLVMVFTGLVSIIVVSRIGRLLGGERAGLVAAGVTAVYANVWVNDGLVMAESPTFLLVSMLTWVVLRHRRESSPRLLVAMGILGGLLALTRAETVLCIPLLMIFSAAVEPLGKRRRIVAATVVGSTALVAVAPWILWNSARFDEPVFLSTNDGLTIAGANCDQTYYRDPGSWDISCAYAVSVPPGADGSVASKAMREAGFSYLSDHQSRLPLVVGARLLRITSTGFIGSNNSAGESEGRPSWVSWLGVVQFWLLIVPAVLGFRSLRNPWDRTVLVGMIPLVVLVAVVANAYVRFRVPAEPGMIILASLAIGKRRRASA